MGECIVRLARIASVAFLLLGPSVVTWWFMGSIEVTLLDSNLARNNRRLDANTASGSSETEADGGYDATRAFLDGLASVPKPCKQILYQDRVTFDTAPACLEECRHGWEWGWSADASISVASLIMRRSPAVICFKVRLYYWFRWALWPQTIFMFLPPIYYAIAVLYILLANYYSRRTYEAVPTHGATRESLQDGTPPNTEIKSGRLNFPWCWVTVSSDADAEIKKLKIAGGYAYLDRLTDVSSTLGFITTGQPLYALGTFSSIIITGDPLQAKGLSAHKVSLQQGYATKGWLEEQLKEGIYEGKVSLLINLTSFMSTPAKYVQGWPEIALRLLSIVPGIFVSIPAASEAEMLLIASQQGYLDLQDQYAVQKLRSQLAYGKYADAFTCAEWITSAAISQTTGSGQLTGIIVGLIASTTCGTEDNLYIRMMAGLFQVFAGCVGVLQLFTLEVPKGNPMSMLLGQICEGPLLQRVASAIQLCFLTPCCILPAMQLVCLWQQFQTLRQISSQKVSSCSSNQTSLRQISSRFFQVVWAFARHVLPFVLISFLVIIVPGIVAKFLPGDLLNHDPLQVMG